MPRVGQWLQYAQEILPELQDAGNVRMVGNLLGDPLREISFDANVEAVFEDHTGGPSGGFTLVQWQLEPA